MTRINRELIQENFIATTTLYLDFFVHMYVLQYNALIEGARIKKNGIFKGTYCTMVIFLCKQQGLNSYTFPY